MSETIKRSEVPLDIEFWEKVASQERIKEVVMNGTSSFLSPHALPLTITVVPLSSSLTSARRDEYTASSEQKGTSLTLGRSERYYPKTGPNSVDKRSVHGWIHQIVLVQSCQIS